MKVLVACEFSGIVREAFRARGHDAWSCDLLDTEIPGHHYQCNIFDILMKRKVEEFDLMIAHPPCTYLCNSGVHWLYRQPGRWTKMIEAVHFFCSLLDAPIEKICVENPVPHKHTWLPPYTQTIQPYQFGEDASKRTCLWLKGLPPLTPTKLVPPRVVEGRSIWGNQTKSGQNKLGPSPTRAADRARTYKGIAEAMAEQWG